MNILDQLEAQLAQQTDNYHLALALEASILEDKIQKQCDELLMQLFSLT